ncbi:MAG: hypothetical protein J2P36_19630 [Ktedonobacteraceae bacterium]|nr:hypothetical protein [Ktedonobacteraceae bacterium]
MSGDNPWKRPLRDDGEVEARPTTLQFRHGDEVHKTEERLTDGYVATTAKDSNGVMQTIVRDAFAQELNQELNGD